MSTFTPCVMLIMNIPIPMLVWLSIPIAASPCILVFSTSFSMPRLPRTANIVADSNGFSPNRNPAATPPNDRCANPSPSNAYLLSTRNTPRVESVIAISVPVMSAFCMNPYCSSSIIFSVRGLVSDNFVVFFLFRVRRILRVFRGSIVFCLGMRLCLRVS